MKYIKRYNEELFERKELDPDTYRRAARDFKRSGYDTKSTNLNDWADINEFGAYTISICSQFNDSVQMQPAARQIPMTQPGIVSVNYTGADGIKDYPLQNGSVRAEEAIEKWSNGNGRLKVSIPIAFRPMASVMANMDSADVIKPIPFLYGNKKVMMAIEISISDWSRGLEEWRRNCRRCGGFNECGYCEGEGYDPNNEDAPCPECEGTGKCRECNGKPINEDDAALMFDKSFWPVVSIRPIAFPNKGGMGGTSIKMGLFGDRKSALAFKKWFNGQVDTNDELRGPIIDMVSILGADPEKIEAIFDALKGIRVNMLVWPEDFRTRMSNSLHGSNSVSEYKYKKY